MSVSCSAKDFVANADENPKESEYSVQWPTGMEFKLEGVDPTKAYYNKQLADQSTPKRSFLVCPLPC